MKSFYTFALLLSVVARGQQVPQTMTKLTVRLQSPDVPDDSFGAKPKTLYRAGNGYCRTEELPDPDHGIHGLMIINEPDTWMVNQFAATAQHYLDAGPTFNCRMPIFVYGEEIRSGADSKKPLFDLEFGREIAYFKAKGSGPTPGPVLRDKPTNVYTSDAGDSQLFLFTTGAPERPWAVARQFGKTREIFWYGTYEQLPFDLKLFAKPTNVSIEKGK